MALFVPLDASYAQDPKILDLDDERSELLFIRSLAYCKAHLTDGLIHRRALHQIAPFADDVHADVLAADLVRAGLWTATDRGWRVTSWLKRNPGSEEILTPSKGRELAHQRHHAKKGIQKEGCPFCFPITEDPQVAAHDAVRDAQHAMPEPYPEPEPEPEPSSASSSPTLTVVEPDPQPAAADEQSIRKTAVLIGRAEATDADNPGGYASTVTSRILTGDDPTDRELIADLLGQGQTPDEIAAGWQAAGPFIGERSTPAPPKADIEAAARIARERETATAEKLAEIRAIPPKIPLAELRKITRPAAGSAS